MLRRLFVLCLLCLLGISACTTAAAGIAPSPTAWPEASAVVRTITPAPSLTASPSPSSPPIVIPTPTATASPTLSPLLFPLRVPLPPDANRRISPNYRFGTDMHGAREIHHGVEFENPIGTPVLAAAEGVVRFAGSDEGAELSPWAQFYGNSVVLEHHFPGWSTPVFTLYAHLSEVLVSPGEQVAAGEVIGLVGMSGSADGPHLHFEVRLGSNAYPYSSNPELWLAPDDGRGSLAGYIATRTGAPIPGLNLSLIPLDEANAHPIYLQTYIYQEALSVPDRQENFALWNLPAGKYRLEFIVNGLQRQEIRIQAGRRTFFTYPALTPP